MCLVVADESCGLMFLDDLEAIYAQVTYFKRFGGQPYGKYDSRVDAKGGVSTSGGNH